MLVCHCMRVRSQDIVEAVEAGARTVREVARCTGAGTRCGGCGPLVVELVHEQVAHARAREAAATHAEVRAAVLLGARDGGRPGSRNLVRGAEHEDAESAPPENAAGEAEFVRDCALHSRFESEAPGGIP
jgi:bacterioferritin-associated ferredoxin